MAVLIERPLSALTRVDLPLFGIPATATLSAPRAIAVRLP